MLKFYHQKFTLISFYFTKDKSIKLEKTLNSSESEIKFEEMNEFKMDLVLMKKSNSFKSMKNSLKDFLSPIFKNPFDKSDEKQLALMFGDWILIWDENELCIPKKMNDQNLIISKANIETITIDNFEKAVDSITSNIEFFNVKCSFSKKSEKNFKTSEDFIKTLVKGITGKTELPNFK